MPKRWPTSLHWPRTKCRSCCCPCGGASRELAAEAAPSGGRCSGICIVEESGLSRETSLIQRRGSLLLQPLAALARSEEHTSELQSLMRISYAGFCLKKKKKIIDMTTRPELQY